MTITWLGQNCFKIEGKTGTLLVDPIDPKIGKMPKVAADLLVLPRPYPEKDRGFLKEEAFVIETPGEFEVKEIFVRTCEAGPKGELVSRFEVDGIKLGHLGSVKAVDETVNAFLENVDVLFVPTGGGDVLGATEAADVVSSIEPRLVIPMHYRQAGSTTLQPVQKFSEALGRSLPESQTKLSLAPKDLPNEETKLVILEA